LHGAREQAVCDVPDVGLVVGVGDPVTEIDRFAESFAEWIVGFLHGVVLGSVFGPTFGAPLALAGIVPEAPGLLEERDGRWSTDAPAYFVFARVRPWPMNVIRNRRWMRQLFTAKS
jgi:hypothetical protein